MDASPTYRKLRDNGDKNTSALASRPAKQRTPAAPAPRPAKQRSTTAPPQTAPRFADRLKAAGQALAEAAMRAGGLVAAKLPSAATMLVIVSLALFGFGLVMGFSASFVYGKGGTERLYSQLSNVAVGLVLTVVLLLVARKAFAENRSLWFGLVTAFWLVSLATMALVLVPAFGVSVNGAVRWLDLPLLPQFQPSELAKVASVLFTAACFERYRESGSWFYGGVIAVGHFLMLLLTLMQKDVGSMVILHVGLIAVLFFGELPLVSGGLRFFTSIASLVLIPVVGVVFTYIVPSHWQARWAAFFIPLDPDSVLTRLANADQLRNGFYAMGDGGLTGLGLGLSKQKYYYLSFPDTDFVYAIVGEELGLVGATAVIVLFLLFAWFGLRVVSGAESYQGKMLAGGATALIVSQAFVNIGGVIGALPLTGKPLPFFSMGGSSIVVTLMLVGCVLAVAWFDSQQQAALRRRDQLYVLDGRAATAGAQRQLGRAVPGRAQRAGKPAPSPAPVAGRPQPARQAAASREAAAAAAARKPLRQAEGQPARQAAPRPARQQPALQGSPGQADIFQFRQLRASDQGSSPSRSRSSQGSQARASGSRR